MALVREYGVFGVIFGASRSRSKFLFLGMNDTGIPLLVEHPNRQAMWATPMASRHSISKERPR